VVPERVIPRLTLPAVASCMRELTVPLILHGGGCRLGHHLAQFKTLPKVLAFLVDARDSLAEARTSLGFGQVLLGNLDGPNLHRCSPEQVRGQCSRMLADRAQDPQFILASSGADLSLTTPPETIRAVLETIKAFGPVPA
jgi:uroporphyrinogen-III decarboxylase